MHVNSPYLSNVTLDRSRRQSFAQERNKMATTLQTIFSIFFSGNCSGFIDMSLDLFTMCHWQYSRIGWCNGLVLCKRQIWNNVVHVLRFHIHDDVIKWKHFPRNWPFVREIHRSPVNFPHKGQWRGALMFSLMYACINDWVNNREAGDLRLQHGHYDVIVMIM